MPLHLGKQQGLQVVPLLPVGRIVGEIPLGWPGRLWEGPADLGSMVFRQQFMRICCRVIFSSPVKDTKPALVSGVSLKNSPS